MSASSTSPSTRQVYLGLFIAGQLLFLLIRNGLEVADYARKHLPDAMHPAAERLAPGWREERGHLNQLMETVDRATKTYAQATEQLQNWSLFPNVGRDCVFPALCMRWDPAAWSAPAQPSMPPPIQFLSDNEPLDIKDFFRLGNYRLRKFEDSFALTLKMNDDETEKEARERWATRIREHLEGPQSYGDMIFAYMRWRLDQYKARTDNKVMPTQVFLVGRRYLVSLPDEAPPFASGPFELLLARWRPGMPVGAGDSPLEMYDPVSDSFRARRK
ncbi:MAG: hypothetical protein HY040_13805 [Planctomycetes bacterium]|nr:hypothetical protein [Planctomycetota bacterium]